MIFNSLTFLLFFIVVFLIYWFPLKNTTRGQNIFLLLASYFFYGYADWKMLPLLIVATLIFYYLGKAIAGAKSEKQGYWLTFAGVALGIGTLLYFKYFNFFIESFASLFNAVGLHANLHTFNIIMPLGISFFTFRLLSYIIDIYRGKGQPTDDIIAFGTYVAFFPCILSGPIDRPAFIKQLQAKREFSYDQAVDGCRQILWGMFKKVVVADNCAIYVDNVWGDISNQSGSTLLLAAFMYSIQLYADFSGYSDMAIGVGKLIGFKIAKNFNYPFFALNISDFWRRWHMSLTSWLTDYVFMPLNIKFRDWGNWGMILAIIINMVLVGMWHGANWTFALFGLYHGLLFIPLIFSGAFFKKAKLQTNRLGLPVPKDFGRIVLTFVLVMIGQLIFRADSVGLLVEYVSGMMQLGTLRAGYRFFLPNNATIFPTNIFIILMFVIEWCQRNKNHGLEVQNNTGIISLARVIFYYALVLIIVLASCEEKTFIYFQF
jgi:D-alanyl-lipoteichoic acid acyltransferase DltB (MBOAT superfamily)